MYTFVWLKIQKLKSILVTGKFCCGNNGYQIFIIFKIYGCVYVPKVALNEAKLTLQNIAKFANGHKTSNNCRRDI